MKTLTQIKQQQIRENKERIRNNKLYIMEQKKHWNESLKVFINKYYEYLKVTNQNKTNKAKFIKEMKNKYLYQNVEHHRGLPVDNIIQLSNKNKYFIEINNRGFYFSNNNHFAATKYFSEEYFQMLTKSFFYNKF